MSNCKAEQKISNPFDRVEGYRCFGCSQQNEHGLKMQFSECGEYMISRWDPQDYYCGYNGILHGGVQATLCDELASWTVYVKKDCSGVTSRLNMKYRKSVFISKGTLTLKAKITEIKRNKFAVINVELYDGENVLCAEAEAIFWMFSKEESINNYGFPPEGMKGNN